MEQRPEEEAVHEVGARGAQWLRSKHAGWVLAAISFAESLFAPIIIDPFLIAFIFARREAWLRYTIIAIVFSVLGGIAAFILGALFYDTVGRPILEFYGLTANFESVAVRIDSNGFVFVLLGALTPIPYKLVAIAAGLFNMNFITFLFASIVGRILRLGLVGIAAYVVGPHALAIIRKRLLLVAYVLAVVLIVYIALRMF
jgi:membrane protein YqaA with SNARE-associated domain